MAFTLTSTILSDGGRLPHSAVFNGFGRDGDNISPDLQWHGAPAGTKSFALTLYDPDAPTTVGWWHWLLFNIPASVTSLEAGAGTHGRQPAGALHGYTDFGGPGYGGAAPPPGPEHRYIFTVYALDVPTLPMSEAGTGAQLMYMMHDHTLAKASLTVVYS